MIPVTIGSKKVNIETDVIDLNIPLLLSKNGMKKAGTKLDFGDDQVRMLGEDVPLKITSSGHYAIKLYSDKENHADINSIDTV